jgi:hypothetical protein
MSAQTVKAAASFAKTPLDLVSHFDQRIRAAGWTEVGRGDPWLVWYQKDYADNGLIEGERELREIMGQHWIERERAGSALRPVSGS